jgi:hypothetical protein
LPGSPLSDGMELLSVVLTTIQMGFIRGFFSGMPDLDGWTKAVDRWTHRDSSIRDRIRSYERVSEVIQWVAPYQRLPDAETEVLVVYQRNHCDETDVTLAIYDDSDEDSPWIVDGGLTSFGKVLLWAEKPAGPRRESQ